MAVKNRVPELVAERFGGNKDDINLSKIQKDTGMTYRSVSDWVKGRVERVDLDVLDKWCKYLGVKPGDILVYEED